MYYHDLFAQQKLAVAMMKNNGNKAGGCSKIFRPWDISDAKLNVIEQQDSTISTTSEFDAEERDPKKSVIKEDNVKVVEDKSSCARSESDSNTSFWIDTPTATKTDTTNRLQSLTPTFYSQDFPSIFLPVCTNLDDSFLLESLSQHGYALEDYARVLNQEHQAKLLNGRKQRPKKYRCPHCNVGFSNNGQLKGHIRIHTGERPFKCEEENCGKTFTRNEELTRHKRIHSGLRPFPCAQCGKRFGRKDHLKKHSRTHLQPRGGLYAVPVVLPLDTWTAAISAAAAAYPPYGHHPFVY